MRGCVYLVGAGCGRADLITLRGLRLLQCCDVVVYDDLIDRHLLEAAPQAAERLYVGKRLGRHSTPQEEISRLLVKKTLEGKVVVRLKGEIPSSSDGAARKWRRCSPQASPARRCRGSPLRWPLRRRWESR